MLKAADKFLIMDLLKQQTEMLMLQAVKRIKAAEFLSSVRLLMVKSPRGTVALLVLMQKDALLLKKIIQPLIFYKLLFEKF